MTAPRSIGSTGKYDAVNIKLDKAGGLTEALALAAEAERRGFAIMVGCMVATSLAMAPAMLVAQRARFVDLDGPLLLAEDRADGCATTAVLFIRPSRLCGGEGRAGHSRWITYRRPTRIASSRGYAAACPAILCRCRKFGPICRKAIRTKARAPNSSPTAAAVSS